MVHPGETAERSERITDRGVPWTLMSVDPFASGDRALVGVPAALADGPTSPGGHVLVLFIHGHNADETRMIYPTLDILRNRCLERGWLVASSYAHGNSWGSNPGLDDYVRVHDWVNGIWPVSDTLAQGESMGGLILVNLAKQQRLATLRAMSVIDGAVNLGAAHADPAYRAAIRTAYGVAADGSDYAAKTAGHDPVLFDPADLEGRDLFISASPGDDGIPMDTYTVPFLAAMGDTWGRLEYVNGTGGHTSPVNHFPLDVLRFFVQALPGYRGADVPPPWRPDLGPPTSGAAPLVWDGYAWQPIERKFWDGETWASPYVP